jgi:hypothetical protein
MEVYFLFFRYNGLYIQVNNISTQYIRDRQIWGDMESYPVHRGAQLHIENDHALNKDMLATHVGDAGQGYIRHAPPFPIFWKYGPLRVTSRRCRQDRSVDDRSAGARPTAGRE